MLALPPEYLSFWLWAGFVCSMIALSIAFPIYVLLYAIYRELKYLSRKVKDGEEKGQAHGFEGRRSEGG